VLPLILSTLPEPDNLVFTYTNKFSNVADNCLPNTFFVTTMGCVDAFPFFDVPELDLGIARDRTKNTWPKKKNIINPT